MEVEALDTAGGVVVRIRGEAGVAEAGALTVALLPLAARRPPCMTFDLGELQFISSLAMGVLVRFRQGVVRAGGHVRLVTSLQEPVREALDRAGLLPLLGSPEGVRSGQELPRNLEAMPSNPVPPLNPRTAELSLA